MSDNSDDLPSGGSEKRTQERRKQMRNRIQRSIEIANEENRRELLRHRIELAKNGLKAYEARQTQDAVRFFLSYLKVLEDWKEVNPNGLHPSLFDRKRDVHELLLINSVYWHLTKIFDQAKRTESGVDYTRYLDKYVLFTIGMSFQPLAAETLRKYLRNPGLVHKDGFKRAYKAIGKSKCFVVTALIDEVEEPTLPRLRAFRDGYLRERGWGRGFVAWYYRWGPVAAAIVERLPRPLRWGLARGIDLVARLVSG